MISMEKTIFSIPKMDCPSEERMIRLRLDEIKEIKKLEFDLKTRRLTVFHIGNSTHILSFLAPLNFGAVIFHSEEVHEDLGSPDDVNHEEESRVLKLLLAINGGMFLIEFITGIMADSMGLISDSLDMLADASVYLISLYAVGKTLALKKRSARVNGYFQIVLGLGVLIETIRRFIYGSDPEPNYMILISACALFANIYCLLLLSKHKEGGVHMRASYICSSTDVMANTGVIIAGVLVFLTQSPYPDLFIGMIVTGIVLRGAFAILGLAR